MLTWLSDPVVRFGFRHAFGWVRLMPLVPVLLIESTRSADGRLARLGLFALCYAAPQAAAYLIEMEHDGRLDQMRLAGRRSAALVTAVLVSVAGPWLVSGVMLTAWSVLAGEANAATLVRIAGVSGLSTMLAAISAMVPFARQRIDPRIGVVGLGVLSMAIGGFGGDLLFIPEASTTFFVIALVIETAVIAACAARVPRRIAHPPVPVDTGSVWLRVPAWEWILRWPGIFRGARLSATGLALFIVFAPMGIVARILASRFEWLEFETAFLYLPPLFIGLIAISLICREDVMSGRLDVVRQSSTRVTGTSLQMLIGLWAPFVAATLGLAILSAALQGVTSTGLLVGLLALVFMAPLPLVEGWNRLWPMTLTLPVVAAIGILRIGGLWPAIGAVSAVLWVAAGRMLRHPERAPLAGWLGVAATTVLFAIVLLSAVDYEPFIALMALAAILIALSPILIDPLSRNRLDRWGQPLAIFFTVLIIGAARFGVEPAGLGALAAVAVWFSAYRIRQWNPSRPNAQAAARAGLLMLFALTSVIIDLIGPSAAVRATGMAGVLVTALLLAGAVEGISRIAGSYSSSMNGYL